MIQMLYEKSTRITGGVKSDMGVGSIVNLQSNDASKIWNLSLYLHIVWNGPFQVRTTQHDAGVGREKHFTLCVPQLCPIYARSVPCFYRRIQVCTT